MSTTVALTGASASASPVGRVSNSTKKGNGSCDQSSDERSVAVMKELLRSVTEAGKVRSLLDKITTQTGDPAACKVICANGNDPAYMFTTQALECMADMAHKWHAKGGTLEPQFTQLQMEYNELKKRVTDLCTCNTRLLTEITETRNKLQENHRRPQQKEHKRDELGDITQDRSQQPGTPVSVSVDIQRQLDARIGSGVCTVIPGNAEKGTFDLYQFSAQGLVTLLGDVDSSHRLANSRLDEKDRLTQVVAACEKRIDELVAKDTTQKQQHEKAMKTQNDLHEQAMQTQKDRHAQAVKTQTEKCDKAVKTQQEMMQSAKDKNTKHQKEKECLQTQITTFQQQVETLQKQMEMLQQKNQEMEAQKDLHEKAMNIQKDLHEQAMKTQKEIIQSIRDKKKQCEQDLQKKEETFQQQNQALQKHVQDIAEQAKQRANDQEKVFEEMQTTLQQQVATLQQQVQATQGKINRYWPHRGVQSSYPVVP